MRYVRIIALLFVPFAFLALTGCGSGTTASNNPFSPTGSGTIFGNISTATGKTGMTLTVDPTTVDVNNGQVLATAKLVSSGTAVSGTSVTFSIVSPTNGPATIDPSLTSVATDSNGIAVTRITTGNVLTTTNVIVKATSTISGQTATAYATFQIVRGSGVINVGSNGTLGQLSFVVDPAATSSLTFLQQIPFTVTDSNGNPRVGVAVTLSVFSNIGNPATVVIDQPTVISDADGKGIFNVAVTMASPLAGSFASASIIYEATTNDLTPITAYVGGVYSLTTPTTP